MRIELTAFAILSKSTTAWAHVIFSRRTIQQICNISAIISFRSIQSCQIRNRLSCIDSIQYFDTHSILFSTFSITSITFIYLIFYESFEQSTFDLFIHLTNLLRIRSDEHVIFIRFINFFELCIRNCTQKLEDCVFFLIFCVIVTSSRIYFFVIKTFASLDSCIRNRMQTFKKCTFDDLYFYFCDHVRIRRDIYLFFDIRFFVFFVCSLRSRFWKSSHDAKSQNALQHASEWKRQDFKMQLIRTNQKDTKNLSFA